MIQLLGRFSNSRLPRLAGLACINLIERMSGPVLEWLFEKRAARLLRSLHRAFDEVNTSPGCRHVSNGRRGERFRDCSRAVVVRLVGSEERRLLLRGATVLGHRSKSEVLP